MLLSIDYGSKYIGLAIAPLQTKIATPYKTIQGEDISLLFKALSEIILKEKITKIIIGYPLGLSGSNSEQTRKTEKFIKECKKEFDLPIIIFDERFTSKMANNLSSGKQNHAIAASIILQDYIDRQTFEHRNI
ncbi:Holliday junction resolvase RuvX [bacterium]|nr:Holliday junction resolvase RuvX [bacterium]